MTTHTTTRRFRSLILCVVLGLSTLGGMVSGGATPVHAINPSTISKGLALPAASLDAPLGGQHTLPAQAAHSPLASLGRRYGQLPISFEVNRGQTNRQVAFLARTGGGNVFLTPSRILLTVPASKNTAPSPRLMAAGKSDRLPKPQPQRLVGMTLLGANRHPQIVGINPLPGRVNYFIGNKPAGWHTNIPTYGGVLYRDVYPGIDLQFHGVRGQLEYDWVVRPGADAAAIRLQLLGAGKMRLDGQGNLRWGSSRLVQGRPRVYQTVAGHRQMVAGRFVLRGNELAIVLGRYDRERELVIDPTISPTYSTYLGGSGNDVGTSVAADGSGNAYVTGYTSSSSFPTAGPPFQAINGGQDAFVTKLNATGSALIYSTYLGGNAGAGGGYGIAIDGSGNAYVTGIPAGNNFPTTPGAFQTSGNPYTTSSFVTKLNAAGSALVYSTYLSGNCPVTAVGIAVDGSGNAYVTGDVDSDGFPTAGTPYQPMYGGGYADAFVSKLNPSGSSLVYSTYLGGSGDDYGKGIAVDGSGDAYVTGYTSSTNFPTTANAFQGSLNGRQNAFVSKLSPSGSALVYSTYLGGSANDFGYGIAVDGSGNAYVAGKTSSANFPTAGAPIQGAYAGSWDAFVSKLSPSGSGLVYSTYLGGSGEDEANGIAVDGWGTAYVTGWAASTNFPTTASAFQSSSAGGTSDAFETTLNSSGSGLVYSTYLGGNSDDYGNGIAVDTSGNVYVAGYTDSPNFPTVNAFQTTYNQNSFYSEADAFIAKFPGVPTPHLLLGLADNVSGTTVSPNGWNWGLTVSNAGTLDATFTAGQTILQDDLPNRGLTYGTVTEPAGLMTNITGSANISCGIDGSFTLTCTATGGPVTIGASTGTFGVVIQVTPSAAGSYTNPRSGGICRVDPGMVIAESGRAGGDCTPDTVTAQATPTVSLQTSGSPSLLGQQVTFTAAVSPPGGFATQPTGTLEVKDTTTNITLCSGAPLSLVSGHMQAACQSSALVHGANSIVAHYNGDGNFAAVDSSPVSQVVNTPHLTLAQVDNVSGHTTYPGGWNWQLKVSNIGDGAATFTAGQIILQDDLPAADLTYGTATVPTMAMTAVTGGTNINCAINGTTKTLTCTAVGGAVTIGAGTGAFGVVIPVMPYAGGTYPNPRVGGICRIDPGNVIIESDRSGSDCSPDTVTVASSGMPTISASPDPVPAGISNTTITWSTGGTGSMGQVYVSVDGDSDQAQPVASGPGGSYVAPWVTAGHTYVFKLYAGTTHAIQLAAVIVSVAGTPSPAAITAGPNPVTVSPGSTSGSTTITWNTGDGTSGQVFVAVDGDSDQNSPVASGASGSYVASFIQPGHTYIFRLYAGTSHATQLAAAIVTTVGSPSPAAITAGPATVPAGSSRTAITWNTGDGSIGQVYVAVDGDSDQSSPFASGASGSIIAAFIQPGHTYVFKLYAGTSHTTQLATAIVISAGGAGPGAISAGPNPVTVPQGQTTGRTAVTWNTGDGTSGQVYVAVDGGSDQAQPFASGASGSIIAAWITPGHTYVFRLYAGTSHTIQLAAVIVTVSGTPSLPAMTASPDPVAAGSSRSAISWNTGDGTSGQVFVAVDGGPDQTTPFASGASGTTVAAFISPGHTYTFKLYAGTTHTNELVAVIVTTAGSTSPAAITAGPNPVPAGSTNTVVTWNTGDGTSGQVFVSVDGGPDQTTPFASGASGSILAAWVTNGHIYTFKLYAGTGHSILLAQVTVSHA